MRHHLFGLHFPLKTYIHVILECNIYVLEILNENL